jgi:hypothetical protein
MCVKQLVACNGVILGWKLFAFLFQLYIPLCSCEILFINYMLCFYGTNSCCSFAARRSYEVLHHTWTWFRHLTRLKWRIGSDLIEIFFLNCWYGPFCRQLTFTWVFVCCCVCNFSMIVCLPLIMLLCSISPWFGWNLVLNMFTNPYKILCGCQNATVFDIILC